MDDDKDKQLILRIFMDICSIALIIGGGFGVIFSAIQWTKYLSLKKITTLIRVFSLIGYGILFSVCLVTILSGILLIIITHNYHKDDKE